MNDTIPTSKFISNHIDSKLVDCRRVHFSYPKLENISALTNPRKSLGVQEIYSNFGYEKCTQAVCRTVPDCTQSWTKYFWTEFGYTLCNQWIPMYNNIRHHIHIFCCASQEDRALTHHHLSPHPSPISTRPWQPHPA